MLSWNKMRISGRFIIAVTILVLVICQTVTASAVDNKCSTGTSYSCPNCGGIEVTDCLDCHGYLSTDVQHNMCIDRTLFQPKNTNTDDYDDHYHYLWNDIVGAIIWFLTAGVAMACGVGGGGIYVPLGILLFQFSPKQASGLSQASIFGASLGGLLLNSRRHHPNDKIRSDPGVPNDEGRVLQEKVSTASEQHYLQKGNTYYTRPVINYDMALFLAPMEMGGAVLGVLVQKMLPNWLYLLIAGLVLSFTSYKTYKKFFSTHKAEMEQEAQRRAEEEKDNSEEDVGDATSRETLTAVGGESSDENEEEQEKASSEDEPESAPEPLSKADAVESAAIAEGVPVVEEAMTNGKDVDSSEEESLLLRKKYLEEDMRQFPREKIAALVILWIGLVILTFMIGGKGVPSLVGIQCDSPWYIVLIVIQFLWLFGFAVYYGFILLRKQDERDQVWYPYLPHDPVWDKKTLRFYGSFTFVAGVVAGLVGIGGGMVLGPLMLVMNVDPRVSSATTATMIVLTSSSVAVMFVTSGLVPWSYAVFYFFVCLIGAIVGKRIIDGYIQRTGRASALVFILATIIALATLGCFVIMFTRLASKGWCLDGFNKFCTPESEDACPVDRLLEGLFP